MPVTRLAGRQDGTVDDIECGIQHCCPMALVVMGHAFGVSKSHRLRTGQATRRSRKRARHLPTVASVSFSRSAIGDRTIGLYCSAAQDDMSSRTHKARSDRLRENEASRARSSSVSTNSAFGLPLVIAASPMKMCCTGKPYLCQVGTEHSLSIGGLPAGLGPSGTR